MSFSTPLSDQMNKTA